MKSFTRNALTSVFTTALDFGVMTGLVEIFGVYYVIATFCGSIAGAVSNFFINRHWSFEATHSGPQWQLARFVPVQAGSTVLSTAGVWLLTDRTHLSYVYSKIIVATAVYMGWNYPMNRWFVFRQWSKPKPS